jgi:hypothetical protein
LEYGPVIRGKEPTICHLAVSEGAPFAYLQCYRNAEYPTWVDAMGVNDGMTKAVGFRHLRTFWEGGARWCCSGWSVLPRGLSRVGVVE